MKTPKGDGKVIKVDGYVLKSDGETLTGAADALNADRRRWKREGVEGQ